MADGFRESEQSWKELLLDVKARGLAMRAEAGHRRRGVGLLEGAAAGVSEHPGATLLGPQDGQRAGQAAQAAASRKPRRSCTTSGWPTRGSTRTRRSTCSSETYEAKYPKAVECLTKDRDVLLAFYDFPAEHWIHMRTTNPIESTFATVRLRTKRTKGSGSRTACLTMVYKLMQSASKNWRAAQRLASAC